MNLFRNLFTKEKDQPAVMVGTVKASSLGYTCMEEGCENLAEYSDGTEYYICDPCKKRLDER